MAFRRNITVAYTSHCPFTEQRQTIEITYTEVPIIGQRMPGYKITKYFCPYGDECPYYLHSHTGFCPVVESAPDRPD